MRAFIRRYGWRAYAVPILAIVTVFALLTVRDPKAPHQTAQAHVVTPLVVPVAPPTASRELALKSVPPGAHSVDTPVEPDALPAGAAYTMKGDGTFRVLKGTSKVVGNGRSYRYDIEAEPEAASKTIFGKIQPGDRGAESNRIMTEIWKAAQRPAGRLVVPRPLGYHPAFEPHLPDALPREAIGWDPPAPDPRRSPLSPRRSPPPLPWFWSPAPPPCPDCLSRPAPYARTYSEPLP